MGRTRPLANSVEDGKGDVTLVDDGAPAAHRPRPIRVLVADADPVTQRSLAATLRDGGLDVSSADDRAEAIRLLASSLFDVLLIDYSLATGPQPDTLSANIALQGCAVIVLVPAENVSDVFAEEDLEPHVADFVVKPPDAVELIGRLRHAQHATAVHEELVRRVDRLERAASIDDLTGVPNRGHLARELIRLSSQARRRRRPLEVLSIDVDEFKLINDEYGHAAGDMALRTLADVIQQAVRAEDVMGRFGGDEFLVLLPDTDAVGAARLAERIRVRVSETTIDAPGGSFHLTVTIGCASGVTIDPGQLLRAADTALYAAKAAGRNRVGSAGAPLRDKGAAITVLIVDDHRTVAESMARLLEREDDILVAGVVTTMEAALEAATISLPEVILFDGHLPEGAGAESAHLLRAHAPDSRVILVTGEDSVEAEAFEGGFHGYINKTRAAEELVETIRAVHSVPPTQWWSPAASELPGSA